MSWAALLFFLLLSLCSCVSKNTAYFDYQEIRYSDSALPSKNMAVVFILVDGLAVETLERSLAGGKVPALKEFFLGKGGRVHAGRAIFPSTTYPNISSILTSRPVDGHPIIGNQMRLRGEMVNFERPSFRKELNEEIEPKTIFSELAERGLQSASFAHYFRAGASVHYHTDIEAALGYLHKDYALVDERLIDSLQTLFSRTVPKEWPFFTFLHVAGVDSLSHDKGPTAPEVDAYLERLDRKLTPFFQLLSSAEANGKTVVAVLTADHGFTSFESNFNIESFLAQAAPGIKALNETRYVSIYFDHADVGLAREGMIEGLPRNPELEMYLERRGNQIQMESAQFSATLDYVAMNCPKSSYGVQLNISGAKETSIPHCPEYFDSSEHSFYAPFFVSDISFYFHSPYHPDALLFAGPGVSFANDQKGGHGGATAEELSVPILLHNVTVQDETLALPTYELLKPMRRK